VIWKQQGRGKSTVASYLAGVFLSLFGIACVAGEPPGGLGFWTAFGNLLCMVGWEGSMGWLFGGLLCVIRADMVNG
jgi:hypothetical protein